jgi:hypothetical protein
MRPQRLRRMTLIGGGALLVIAVIVAIVLIYDGETSTPSVLDVSLSGLQTGSDPWPPEYVHMLQRIQAIGLPAQPSMATLLHHHDLLEIFVNGRAIDVPASIGIYEPAAGHGRPRETGYLTSLHTHDATGIIHVESPAERSFDLGEFFDVWGLRLTSTCIGGYCNDSSQTLTAYLNGTLYTGDPRTIPLTQHEDIVLAFGTPSELPDPVPSSYSPSISPTCAPSC